MPVTSLVLNAPTGGWVHEAACAGMWSLMEAPTKTAEELAVDVCRSCPVWRQCRDWVLSLPPRQDVPGVAGGLTEAQRSRARRRIRRRHSASEQPRAYTGCRMTKPASEFYQRVDYPSGRESRCITCTKEKNRAYKARQRAGAAVS